MVRSKITFIYVIRFIALMRNKRFYIHFSCRSGADAPHKIDSPSLPFAFISPKGRLNSLHNGTSAQELSFELSSEAGTSGAIIHVLISLWLFIITSDSGIRRRISWLVFLFIGRRAVTHSLSYPDRPQRLAITFFSAGIQLPGSDVPVRHAPVVPFLCLLSPYDKLQPKRITEKVASAGPRPRRDRGAYPGYLAASDLAGN